MQIKIGTRNSPLAMWQAHFVKQKLEALGTSCEIVPILASGDKNLTQPLYELGITGVFTKDLDIALLENKVDIAVHSLKDIPTRLPKNLILSCVLERDFPEDVLVRNANAKHKKLDELSIATSSLRRRSFWKQLYPNTHFTDIRGNVQTRLQKLNDGLADATLFSLAGIKRMEMELPYELLDFMLPAPAQGVVACVCRDRDDAIINLLKQINHLPTQNCIDIERDFLQHMEGGCTAPIGALAKIINDEIVFEGRITSLDGTKSLEIKEKFAINTKNKGKELAQNLLDKGADAMMIEIKKALR